MSARFPRSCGIVMPIFSLPSPYGIGTFGKAAYEFADFLKASGQKYWQILPLGHTGFGDSPYQVFSVVAGNPYFIDLDMLVEDGLLSQDFLNASNSDFTFSSQVNYEKLQQVRLPILREARKNASPKILKEVKDFATENNDWLPDYALFMALKNHFKQKPIWLWEDEHVKSRNPKALEKYSHLLADEADFYIFLQYLFFKQWSILKSYVNNLGIKIIGDIPIYPSPDSVDVWVNPRLFKVDENLLPNGIAGVPPDCYSETGQLWGNPVYDWDVHKKQNFSWWVWRIKQTLKISDVIRIDHFRALQDYWEIPAGEETALNGKWVSGPRMPFFDAIKNQLGDIPIIAEDLGIITDSVREFLKQTGYPGMKVMIFGLQANEDNIHLPHNCSVNTVGYTSTHDSETFAHAFEKLSAEDRQFTLNYLNANSISEIGLSAIRSLFASPACIAMFPIQDLFSIGAEGRINTPSTIGGNWGWRLNKGLLTDSASKQLLEMTKTYKRYDHSC